MARPTATGPRRGRRRPPAPNRAAGGGCTQFARCPVSATSTMRSASALAARSGVPLAAIMKPGQRRTLRRRARVARRSLRLFRAYKWRALGLLVVVAVTTTLDLLPALLIGLIVDEPIQGDADFRRMGLLFAGITAMYAVSAVCSVWSGWINQQIGQGIMYDLRAQLHAHLQRVSVHFFTSSRTGEILSRVSNDVNQLQIYVTQLYAAMLTNGITLLIAMGLMVVLNWQLAVAAILLLLLWVLPTMKVGQHMRRLQRARQEETADMSAHLEETLSVSGSMLVRAFGRQDHESQRFSKMNDSLRTLAIRQVMAGRWFQMSTRLFGSVAIGFVFWLGSYGVAENQVSVGSVVAFALLTQRVFQPFSLVARGTTDIIASLAIFQRIYEYLDLPVDVDEKADAVQVDHPRGVVEFDRVGFAYDAADGPALHDISFRLEPGQMAALVGPSGAGKTTVTYLLQRFYDPGEGAIRLDGHDLRDLTLDTVARTIGTVAQDTSLFNSTLIENIRYGRIEATDEEVEEAAQTAGLRDLVERLPEGLHTRVGERGYHLSGGEKQRVSIARAILKDPPVLVLDEATASLDSLLEREIREATSRLSAGRTTVVIAHRLSTIVSADVIFVMQDGRIIDRGTHEELLARGGLYARLYHEQFGGKATVSPADGAPEPSWQS
ncbi:MAG: ATP-binding cassette domain-containing protein [Dehalococcoidia bacterium]|nr:ATP-binding cassette domain-containing protein [Dehalococcoidia bacterium]